MAFAERVALLEQFTDRYGRNVPSTLRDLEAEGPTAVTMGRLGGYHPVSCLTPHIARFMLDLVISNEPALATKTFCARWVRVAFANELGSFDQPDGALERFELHAAELRRFELPEGLYVHGHLDEAEPRTRAALEQLTRHVERGERPSYFLHQMLRERWTLDLRSEVVRRLDEVLAVLESTDEALRAEVIALVSSIRRDAPGASKRLEELVRRVPGSPESGRALVGLARLRHTGIAAQLAVMADSLEGEGGDAGLASIYVACADVLASAGRPGARSRRLLAQVPRHLAERPEAFEGISGGTLGTLGALVGRVRALLLPPA